MRNLWILKSLTMVLTLSWALSGCGGAMVKMVSDPGALPMASVKLPCVNIEPLKVEVLGTWPEGRGACFKERGQEQVLSAQPASGGPVYSEIRLKLNVLMAGLKEGDEVLAIVDHSAPKLQAWAGPAAQYGVHLEGMADQGGTQEFPGRWMSSRIKIGAPGDTSRDQLLVVRCVLGPCRVGRIGWIRAPRN